MLNCQSWYNTGVFVPLALSCVICTLYYVSFPWFVLASHNNIRLQPFDMFPSAELTACSLIYTPINCIQLAPPTPMADCHLPNFLCLFSKHPPQAVINTSGVNKDSSVLYDVYVCEKKKEPPFIHFRFICSYIIFTLISHQLTHSL